MLVTARGQLGAGGEYSFPNAVADVLQVFGEIAGDQRILLIGRSAGAPVALRVARHLGPKIDKILLWGASPGRVYRDLFGPGSDGTYMKACADCGSSMASDFVETLFFPEDEILHVACPVWVGIGAKDEYSGIAEQAALVEKSSNTSSLLLFIPRASHAVTRADSAWSGFNGMVKSWLSV